MKTVNHSFESLRYLGPKMWETIPSHLKETDSFKNFKNAIKKWKPESCSCRVCKIYIQNKVYIVDLCRKNFMHFLYFSNSVKQKYNVIVILL